MDFTPYLDMLATSDFWRLFLELIIVPRFLVGPEFGLIRFLGWFKEWAKLKGVKVLGIPAMALVAGFFSAVAALVVSFVDGTITDVAPEPTVVIGYALALFALGQAWYGRIAAKVDLQKLTNGE